MLTLNEGQLKVKDMEISTCMSDSIFITPDSAANKLPHKDATQILVAKEKAITTWNRNRNIDEILTSWTWQQ